MMKITRRNFGKVVAGALVTAVIPFVPKVLEVKAEEVTEKKMEMTLQNYEVGEEIYYEDLIDPKTFKSIKIKRQK